jgi:hypothetical protein
VVFLSYAQGDKDFAKKLAQRLQAAGFDVWDSAQRVLPGDNWAAKVASALEEADAMVVLLSPEAVVSPNVQSEIQYALGSPHFKDRLIPVVVRSAKNIPWILRRLPLLRATDQEPGKVALRVAGLLKKRPAAVGA